MAVAKLILLELTTRNVRAVSTYMHLVYNFNLYITGYRKPRLPHLCDQILQGIPERHVLSKVIGNKRPNAVSNNCIFKKKTRGVVRFESTPRRKLCVQDPFATQFS